MEIKSTYTIKGQKVFEVFVENQLISKKKIIEFIENIDDYLDFKPDYNAVIVDKGSMKEDLLNPRTYLVKEDSNSSIGYSCECKGYYYNKNCRHICFILEHKDD